MSHQGIWRNKKKFFPKIKPTLPVGKKNIKGQLITNPDELKELYLNTFKDRLRQRPAQPGYENLLNKQEELFKLRLEMAKRKKSAPWKMTDLDEALKTLKTGKCRDPEGLLREVFKEEVIGSDLKHSMLVMFNKIKETRIFPKFMRTANISVIYKGKGEVSDLDSDRGILLVSIFVSNHIFVVNSIIHDVLSKKSKDPIDIMILDYKQMFDLECLFQCMNDLYEAGVDDDIFALIYESNRENYVAVKTPNGLSRRDTFNDIVMQGDVLAPLISSLQVDTMGKECLEDNKPLYLYKNMVPIPPLGLVDDLFTISTCNYNSTLMNKYINSQTAMKRLQFGTTKCFKMHIGKTCNEALCRDLFVGGWKREVVEDPVTGQVLQTEFFGSLEKMQVKTEQMYLGDVISADGRQHHNVQQRKNKGLGSISQIMQILETVFFGKYHFEVAMILRSSMLLSALLLNSEAWVNLTKKDIRSLEKTDEILLSN